MRTNSLPITAALPGLRAIQLPIFWVKELRIILPTVLGCGFLLLLSVVLPHEFRNSIVVLVYPLSCSAVFALAFGHDYMQRTLTGALAQPVDRRKIFWTRMLLCTTALLPLTALEFIQFEGSIIFSRYTTFVIPWTQVLANLLIRIFEPIVTAICLAPCLTILTRSALFGTIISATAPFALAVAVRAIAIRVGFEDGPRLVTLHLATSFTLLATGAVLTYRRFITQEALETDVTLHTTRRAFLKSQISNLKFQIPFRRSSPLFQLIRKELILQRLPAAMALLCVAVVFLFNKDYATILSAFYPAAIIILTGAIASAEERRMGIIPLQVCHPISFRTQWLTKIAVAYFAALLFGAILPAAAVLLKTDELKTLTPATALQLAPLVFGGVLLILSATIYISSVCENAIRAMLATLFVLIMFMILLGPAYDAYFAHLFRRLNDVALVKSHMNKFAFTPIGFIPLALYFAMQNHRSLDRSRRGVFNQVAALILYELAALVVIALTI